MFLFFVKLIVFVVGLWILAWIAAMAVGLFLIIVEGIKELLDRNN